MKDKAFEEAQRGRLMSSFPSYGNRRYSGLHVPSFRGASAHKPIKLTPKKAVLDMGYIGDPVDKVAMAKRHNYNNNACNKHARKVKAVLGLRKQLPD